MHRQTLSVSHSGLGFQCDTPSFSSYGLLMVYACIYGITMGRECSLTPVICSDVAGKINIWHVADTVWYRWCIWRPVIGLAVRDYGWI